MPGPLLPGDHPVLVKLCDELLPWMIAARRVGRQWFVRLAAIFGYLGDFAAALAGLGIGAPIAALMQGNVAAGGTKDRSAIDVLHTILPAGWSWAGLAALIVWTILRLVIQRQDVLARALLAREYGNAINALYAQLYKALQSPEPMDGVLIIQKSVDDRVQDAIKKGYWPYSPPFPPTEDIQQELATMAADIRTRYMSKWRNPPPGSL
jgi:hypothetical protein